MFKLKKIILKNYYLKINLFLKLQSKKFTFYY